MDASNESKWGDVAGVAGQIGASAILARYSRDAERQSDDGGMRYMVRAGYDPQGMVTLTRLMAKMESGSPSLMQAMFASHPMSSERLATAETRARTLYANQNSGVIKRDAFQAATAKLRKQRPAIQNFAKAEQQLARGNYAAASTLANEGLKSSPNDSAGLMILAQANQKLGNDITYARSALYRTRRNMRSSV